MHCYPPRKNCRAFTLLELLISFVLLSIISVSIFGIVNSTSSLWRQTKGKVETFRESQAAFETIVQRLTQATLNTYWGFDDPDNPQEYERLSELHFVSDVASELLGTSAAQTPTSAVFFQAPIGYAKSTSRLNNLLNEVGYFIEFGSDTGFVPTFLQETHKARLRYRLMEFLPVTEDLLIYSLPESAANNAWFQQAAIADPPIATRPIAENIIALVVRARFLEEDDTATPLTTTYLYDTREEAQPGWLNQLPPVLDVLMVAIDETSAERLAESSGANPPLSGVIDPNWFTTSANFESDVESLRTALSDHTPPINYRVFQTTIAPREAKWAP